MKSGHKAICICVGLAAFFGCMALEPVGTLAFTAGAVWWVRTIEE
jgi:hypothetical protein